MFNHKKRRKKLWKRKKMDMGCIKGEWALQIFTIPFNICLNNNSLNKQTRSIVNTWKKPQLQLIHKANVQNQLFDLRAIPHKSNRQISIHQIQLSTGRKWILWPLRNHKIRGWISGHRPSPHLIMGAKLSGHKN